MIEHTTNAYSEHTKAMDVVENNIGSINIANRETNHTIESVSQTIETLNMDVEELRALIEKFKVK